MFILYIYIYKCRCTPRVVCANRINVPFHIHVYRLSEKMYTRVVCHPILLIYFFILYPMLMYIFVVFIRALK